MKFELVSLFLLLFSYQAKATVAIDLDAEAGRGFFATHVGLSKSFEAKEGAVYFSQFNVSAGGNQSKYEDSNTGVITTTRGREGQFGAGIGYAKKWNLDLSLFSNITAETNYGESGSHFQASYTSLTEELDNFGFSCGVGGGKSNIGQKVSFRILNTTINRDVDLEKNERNIYLRISASPWLSVRFDYYTYSYSRSKADLQTAYSSRFLTYYTSDLVSSIGGLPENSGSVLLTTSVLENWDFSLLTQTTHLIVDDSNSNKLQLSADRFFESWTGGLGLSRSETKQATETSVLARFSFEL